MALAAWSGWGGLSAVFDETKAEWATEHRQLRELLSDEEYAAARAGVLNAHYTHPQYAAAIWDALSEMGVTQGRALEPGCGVGTFIGLSPKDVAMTGVELDGMTARIAAALYPSATIRAEGYETTPTQRLFDAAVGNVPFGDVRLFDPANNPGNHTIHNHFIIKALSQTKPGGVVAVLTSHYTLDALNPAARRDMYERADLLGAVRLPTGAHRRIADTEVVTDVLLFRVRKDGEEPQPFTWEHSQARTLPGSAEPVPINRYFADNPGLVLGEMRVDHGMYNANTLIVDGPDGDDLVAQLTDRLNQVRADAAAHGLVYDPAPAAEISTQITISHDPREIGSLRATDRGGFQQLTQTGWDDLEVPRTQQAELAALLDLRDRTRSLLDAEAATTADSPALDAARRELRASYDAYVARFGPLNRVTKTARVNAAGEESLSVRRPPVMARFFNRDPYAALTRAIEQYDDETGLASPAPLLQTRQVFARYTPKGADDAADALTISVENRGRVDLPYIAYLLGTDEAGAREQLRGLVFTTPDGDLVTRQEYLSGNVRSKLKAAEAAAETDPALQENVEALREVMPRDLTVADITPEPGATWISADYHRQFVKDALGIYGVDVTWNPVEGWKVTGGGTSGIAQTSTWGTPHRTAQKIFEHLLNNTPIRVTYKDQDNNEIFDAKATEAAKGKAEQITAAFKRWIWSDPNRATDLLHIYNERFNSLVPRSYDDAGSRLRLPGLALSFELRAHQRAAIARMIAEPTTGLFHEVGAGKTLEMICGAMEQKRLGLIHKPMVVVPNHMLGQFEREWLQAYPHAKLLAADTEDISSKTGRGDFMARVTTGDWDAVICTQSAFRKIGVQPQTYIAYQSRQLEELESWMKSSSDQMSVRQAENKRQKLRQKIAAAQEAHKASTDGGVTFEQLGVDYLIVDEAHYYKNLSTPTFTQGLIAQQASAKCEDLDMKLGWLRDHNGDRVATFATATPIANTMGEMWVMTHYLRPDLLKDAGVEAFDAWVKTFTSVETRVEVNAVNKVKVRQRVARFQNLPELMTMWGVFADVKTRDDLDLPLPKLTVNDKGERAVQIISADIGPAMSEFTRRLEARAEKIEQRAVAPSEDNFLSITNDGRAMATDHRLLRGDARDRALAGVTSPIGTQKPDLVARNIARIYEETKHNTYLDESGRPSATPGALQIVFADLGTPKPGEWNLYDELKQQLIDLGVPADKIAYTHDAKNSVEKDRIFARARSGSINVLIGSTEKMGTGANMQARAIALHHVTAPWRPADINQREGRIIRQGNQNPEVSIYRYVTERSFDTYLWQTLERKATFINQIMGRKYDGRDLIDDASEEEVSYAQVKAIASGNPLVMEEARLKSQVMALTARSDAHESQQRYLAQRAPALDRFIHRATERAHLWETVASHVTDTSGDKFRMRINDTWCESRADAAEALHDAFEHIQTHRRWLVDRTNRDQIALPNRALDNALRLEIGGQKLSWYVLPAERDLQGYIRADKYALAALVHDLLDDQRYTSAGDGATFTLDDLNASPLGVVRRIESHVQGLSAQAGKIRNSIAVAQEELDRIHNELATTNPWTDQLTTAKAELADVRARMRDHEHAGQDTTSGHDRGTQPSRTETNLAKITRTFQDPKELMKKPNRHQPAPAPHRHNGPSARHNDSRRGPTL